MAQHYYKELNLSEMAAVLQDVGRERIRQYELWGNQQLTYGQWLCILGEEFGEVFEAFQPVLGIKTVKPTDADDVYEELIQLAAVSVKIAELIKSGGVSRNE